MANINKVKSFLTNLSTSELEEIKQDLKNVAQGNEIFYVVDTFDIVNYTLPFTDENYIESIDDSTIFYKAISYEKIFGQESKIKLCLLDEYKAELLSIKNNIYRRLNSFPALRKKFINLLKNNTTLFNKNNSEEIERVLSDNFELIVFIMIFIEHGENIYQRFSNFLKQRIDIFEFNSGVKEVDQFITEIFSKTKGSDLSLRIFDKFVEDSKIHLLSLDSDIDRYIFLENSFRDIVVVDRLLHANKLIKQNPDHKFQFHYLSSAPYKSNQIFSLMKDSGNRLFEDQKDLNLGIHRNIYQVFLLDFLSSNVQSNIEQPVNFINSLISIKTQFNYIEFTNEMLEKKEVIELLENPNSYEVLNSLRHLLDRSRNEIENSFFYSTYKEYSNKVSQQLNNLKKEKNYRGVSDFVSVINKYLKKDSLFVNIDATISNLEVFRQTYLLSNKMKYIKKQNLLTFIPLGQDIIKNCFHHLPYLLFLSTRKNEISKLLYEFFDSITDNPLEIEKTTTKFNSHLGEIINAISISKNDGLFHVIQEFLILYFINIIAPTPETFSQSDFHNFYKKEDEILSIIKNQKSLIKNSIIRPKVEISGKTRKVKLERLKSNLICEIDYFQIWLLRRNRNFDKCIEICNSYINNKQFDNSRFLHGRGLTFCSIAYDSYFKNRDSSEIISNLKLSINDLLNAKELYETIILKNKDDIIFSRLLWKNIIGILNNIIDSKIRIIEITKQITKKDLDSCRNHLMEVKRIFKNKLNHESTYDDFPTINHTEAELEYYEAKDYFDRGLFIKAYEKINEATIRSYFFEKKTGTVSKNFRGIIKNINSLRFQIFKEKK